MKSLLNCSGKMIAVVFLSFLLTTSVSAQRPSRPGRMASAPAHSGGIASSAIGVRPPRASRPVFYGAPRFYSRYYGPYFHYYTPWLGVRLRVLPWGYFSFNFGPDVFYYYDGIFYRNNNDSYEVVAPPVGAEVPSLPRGASEIRINGELFYEKNGVYYREVIKDNNKKAYVVAGRDGELNTSEAPQPKEGDVVHELPADSRLVVINDQEFYLSPSGFYYQEIKDGDKVAYKVVGSASPANER